MLSNAPKHLPVVSLEEHSVHKLHTQLGFFFLLLFGTVSHHAASTQTGPICLCLLQAVLWLLTCAHQVAPQSLYLCEHYLLAT